MYPLIIVGATYLIALPVIVCAAYLFLYRGRKRRMYVLLCAIALPLSYAIGFILGHLYNNPRPFVVDRTVPLVRHAADNGFPSGHTLLAATLASIIFVFNRRAGIALYVVALIIGLSRVAAGVHHLLDILASLLVSVVSVFLSALVVRNFQKK